MTTATTTEQIFILNIKCVCEYFIDKYLLQCKPRFKFLPTRYFYLFLEKTYMHTHSETWGIFGYRHCCGLWLTKIHRPFWLLLMLVITIFYSHFNLSSLLFKTKLLIHFIFDAFQHSLDLTWKMDRSQHKMMMKKKMEQAGKNEVESNENEQWMRIM